MPCRHYYSLNFARSFAVESQWPPISTSLNSVLSIETVSLLLLPLQRPTMRASTTDLTTMEFRYGLYKTKKMNVDVQGCCDVLRNIMCANY